MKNAEVKLRLELGNLVTMFMGNNLYICIYMCLREKIFFCLKSCHYCFAYPFDRSLKCLESWLTFEFFALNERDQIKHGLLVIRHYNKAHSHKLTKAYIKECANFFSDTCRLKCICHNI